MKVYVTTKAEPFNSEQYKSIGDNDAYSSDRDNTWILFIHEEEV